MVHSFLNYIIYTTVCNQHHAPEYSPLITKIYLPAFIHIELIAGKQKSKIIKFKKKIISDHSCTIIGNSEFSKVCLG